MHTNIEEENRTLTRADAEIKKEELKKLVERFEVCWEVLPDCYCVRKEIRQIGFQLQLSGTHEVGAEHPSPGCEHCQRVWRALKEISEWIMPSEIRDSGYDVYPFDQTIRYCKERNYRPEVSLSIWIRHRSGFDREVDACEVRCLTEMTQKLRVLGARRKQWRPD